MPKEFAAPDDCIISCFHVQFCIGDSMPLRVLFWHCIISCFHVQFCIGDSMPLRVLFWQHCIHMKVN